MYCFSFKRIVSSFCNKHLHSVLKIISLKVVVISLTFLFASSITFFQSNKVYAAEAIVDNSIVDVSDEIGMSPTLVFTDATTGYAFFIDAVAVDLAYRKTTDGGSHWDTLQVIDTTITGWTSVAVWYDQWTPGDTTGTKIHIAASDITSDDVFYTFLDTNTDTLKGSMVAVLAGTAITPASTGAISITKGAGGALFITSNFTTTAGSLVSKSTDGAGDTWSNITPASYNATAIDQIQLLPLITNNDVIAIRAQTSDNTVRYRIYNEGSDTWDGAWSSSITSLTESTTYDQWFSASLKKSSGTIYLALSNFIGDAGNDLEFWTFSDSTRTWTQEANIMTNDATVMMPVPVVKEDTGDVYVAYFKGNLNNDMGVFFKKSEDGGDTWGAESPQLHGNTDDLKGLRGNLLSEDLLGILFYCDDRNDIFFTPLLDDIEVTIDSLVLDATDEFSASPNTVATDANTIYTFYIDNNSQSLAYNKSTDAGKNWLNIPVVIDTVIAGWANVSVWYDQWTPGDTTGTRIHIAASDDSADDIFYTYLDTSGDSLKGSMVTAVSGTTTLTEASDGPPSITKGAGGALFISANFTNTAGGKVSKSTDGAGNTWSDVTPSSWSANANDQVQIVPLLTDNDIIAIKAQSLTDQTIRYRIYDESGDAWDGAWSAAITSLTGSNSFDNWFSATIKKSTGDVYLALSNDTGAATSDLEFWSFSDSTRTWTQGDNLIDNDANMASPVPIMHESAGDIYVVYLRGTAGTSMNVYFKKSTDGGATWSAESTPLNPAIADDFKTARANILSDVHMYVTWFNDDINTITGKTVPFVPEPDLDQIHYRWRNDDDDEIDATWAAAEDTVLSSISKATPYRLRFMISNEGGALSDLVGFQIQVAENATCSAGTYAAVPTDTSGHWQISPSTHITDGNPTTNVASGLTDENASFYAGEVKDTGNTTGNISLTSSQFTEIEYSLVATSNATDGGQYCFRLTNVDTYTEYAQVTITSGADPEYTLSTYRFYVDSDDEDVTDPWGVSNIPEDTLLALLPANNFPPPNLTELRIRIGITVSAENLSATSQQFKLQYKTGTDATCTTGSWTDVGAGGGGEIWRFATSSEADGTTLSTLRLSTSDILGVYSKANPTATNPNSAVIGETVEYDFHIQNNGAGSANIYSFRVVESDNSVLTAYTYCPTLTTKQSTNQELRHGNVFSEQEEQGFTRAD